MRLVHWPTGLVLALLASAEACTQPSADDTFKPPVIKVEITPAQATIRTGEQVRLSVEVRGIAEPNGFTWFSKDSTIASVSQDGVVTGRRTGEVLVGARPNADQAVDGLARIHVQ